MDQIAWILWLVLGIVLLVAEIFTLGFVLFWFGLGALAAALVGFVGLGFGWQFAVFALVSVALTAMSKTIFANYLPGKSGSTIKSNIDSLPGQIGTVTTASSGTMLQSAVHVYGSTWTAYPIDGETTLTEGEKVEVVEVKGASIYVRRITNELPEWRSE